MPHLSDDHVGRQPRALEFFPVLIVGKGVRSYDNNETGLLLLFCPSPLKSGELGRKRVCPEETPRCLSLDLLYDFPFSTRPSPFNSDQQASSAANIGANG